MKRYIILFMSLVILIAALTSCGGNRDLWDTNYQFDRAVIGFPDGTTKVVTVKQWTDYEDGEQIQIIADDGTIYLVSSYNCILINDPD